MSTDATAVMAPPDNDNNQQQQQQPQPQPQLVHSPPHNEIADEPSTTTVDPNDIAMKDSKSHDNDSQKPIGLHSPPDSNNAMKLDTSDDSDLSDLEDPAPDMHSPQANPPFIDAKEEEVEDIGDVVPDHWSGTVPVFKPDMHQFKDFKKFVCRSSPPSAISPP